MSSSSTIFRDKDITIGPGKHFILKKKSVEDIFKFDSPPYIILGQSGCGKTKLSMHLMYRYAKECTKIFYVSSTKGTSFDSTGDDDINVVPKVFRRSPTFESLYGIWRDIISEKDAFNASPEEFEHILKQIWANEKEDIKSDIKLVNDECTRVYQSSLQMYKGKGIESGEADKQAKRDSNAIKCSMLAMMVIDSVKQKGSKGLTEKEMIIVNSIVSRRPKTLLILDDVTTEMESMKTARGKMVQYNGASTSVDRAYTQLLIDILTRARHHWCMVAIFLHSIDSLPKSLIRNLIIFDNSGIAKIRASRMFANDVKNVFGSIAQEVFVPDYKYFFIAADVQDNRYCVGKADLFSGPIELSPINQELVKAYDAVIKSGTDEDAESSDSESGGDKLNLDESEDSSSGEEDGDGGFV